MPSVPRTVTIPVLLVCSIFSGVFFSSCADKIKTDIIAFEALDEGLVNSNIVIGRQNQTVLESLQQKLTEPLTVEKAKLWYPKAEVIQRLSKDIYTYIEGLRSDLKKEAGLKTNDGVESFKESDKISVMRLFEKKGKAEELYERLKNYKRDLLAIDLELGKEFNNTIVLTTPAFDAAKEKQDFNKTFFDDIPAAAALAVLSKFQNNTKIIENKTIGFCNAKTNSAIIIDWWPTALVNQNINHARVGESIEITAGVGSFISSSKTEVAINGKKVPVGEGGVAVYKFNADKPGKYVVPVAVSFTDQEGKKQTITKNIEYTVANL